MKIYKKNTKQRQIREEEGGILLLTFRFNPPLCLIQCHINKQNQQIESSQKNTNSLYKPLPVKKNIEIHIPAFRVVWSIENANNLYTNSPTPFSRFLVRSKYSSRSKKELGLRRGLGLRGGRPGLLEDKYILKKNQKKNSFKLSEQRGAAARAPPMSFRHCSDECKKVVMLLQWLWALDQTWDSNF